MTIEELSQYLSAYIDQKVEEVKLQLFYNPNSRVAVGLSEFEDKEMKQYSGFEYLKHETMRMLVRNLAKLGVDGFGKEKIETLTALDSTDSPGGYSLVLEDPHPVLGVAEAALLILPVNDSDKDRLQIAFFIEGEQLRISSRNGSYLSWGDWAKSNDIGKSIVAGDYDNLRERFIGQGLGQDQVANRRLDNLICRRYRNLEGDVFLPVQDYEGRTRPIETKILLKEKNIGGGVNEFILENTPYIGDMVQNPTDWLVYNITTHGNPQTLSVKVLTCEYIGDYEGSTNCCRITVNMDIANLVVGYHVGILSWKAKGLVLNYTPAFPIDIDGHGRTYCVGASWYDSINNIYRALVSVEYESNPIGKRTCIKTYRSTDRLIGAWTQDNIDAVDDFADLIPETHKGFTQFSGFAKYPGSSGLMFCMIGLYDDTVELRTPYGTCTQVAILIFNEDLSHKRMIIPTLDYVFENRLNIHSYGSSITHYKGRYVMSIHDGGSVQIWPEEEAGKRVMLSSKNIEGPYSLDSTIIDLDDEWVNMVGSPINQAVANGQIFVFNGDLYYLLFGAAIDGSSGSLGRHEGFLFKYNDSTKTWALTIPGPVLTALFGHSSNYPELNLTWGNAHMGSSTFHYIEGNKLWMCFAATGGRYASSIGYIDLDKALS